MDIRISPSKLGNRYVLGRAGKDIRNVTGSLRIDGFAAGIISKYQKPEETDLPRTEMELLKRPELPEALSDIQEIIDNILIINRNHTDVENSIFRNISIENNILRINMLLSRLEAGNQYKEIRQGLENIYHVQLSQPAFKEIKEGSQLELPLGTVTEAELVKQIETVLREGGIRNNELLERIMTPAEKTAYPEQKELTVQPGYIPMNTSPLSRWKSQEAKNFFWQVQRLGTRDRELVLKSLGNISVTTLQRILSEMDEKTWHEYSASIAEKIKFYMDNPEEDEAGEAGLMAEPVPAENYYSSLIDILGGEAEPTPELLLEEKENLIRFLEREDTDTERIRGEVIRIINDIHRNAVFTPSVPDAAEGRERAETEDGAETAVQTVREEISPEEAALQKKKITEEITEDTRKKAVARVIEDIETMDITEFSRLYERIRENAAELPQDVAERLLPSLTEQTADVTEDMVQLQRQNVLTFLKKNETEQGYFSELLLKDIVRADEHRIRNYARATEIAETAMNLSVEEWQRFVTELKEISEKSELSRRYIKADSEAREAAEKAREEDRGADGMQSRGEVAPELKDRVESTREKMVFISQLDRAFKEGVDIFEEGDILTQNSVFSQYIHRRGSEGVNAEVYEAPEKKTVPMVMYLTKENLKTLTEKLQQKDIERKERQARLREEIYLTRSEERSKASQIETILEQTERIYPQLRMRTIRSSMEPMLEEIRAEGASRTAAELAAGYLEKRRDARTSERIEMEVPEDRTPVELVTVKKNDTPSREEIAEIKKTAEETKKLLNENTADIRYIKGDSDIAEITNERTVDMKSIKDKLTVQENEIEKIKEIQEQLLRSEKSDSYYTKKTITRVNQELRMERLRRGL